MIPLPRLLGVAAVLIGFALVLRLELQNRRLLGQVRLLEARLDSPPIPIAPPPPTSRSADPDPELLRLRGDIAQLRRDLAALTEKTGTRTAGTAASDPHERAALLRRTVQNKKAWTELDALPPAVAQALQSQLGDTPLQGARLVSHEDGTFFLVDTRLSDGRGIEIAVDEQGVVRSRHMESSLDRLDPGVQTEIGGIVGDIPVRQVMEIFKEGQTRYVVQAKSPEQGLRITLGPDGTVLRTEWERPERERPVP
jgi:hypothetical protein